MSLISIVKKDRRTHLLKTLRYALYVVLHPFDGFWDLTHENRGSVGAANAIVIMVLLTRLGYLKFTNFMFNPFAAYWDELNLVMQLLSILAPLIIWCVANWGTTTLMEGKGTLRKVYMATAYALTPYILLQVPCIIISNFITLEEGAFYNYLMDFSMIWCAVLLLSAMMMIHEYTLGKTLFATLASLFGMLVIVFILLLFFSLISDAFAYFISLYKEAAFRFY